MPTVSIIIATYNHAEYLAAAVDSVFAQTFKDWELVVVDDGSTDQTPGVLEKLALQFPGRFRFVRQENAGVGAAMNRGLAETSAPLVAFLDSDDTWTPDHLATLVPMLEEKRDRGSGIRGQGKAPGSSPTDPAPDPQPPTPVVLGAKGTVPQPTPDPRSPTPVILAFGRRDVMDARGRLIERPAKPFFTGRVTGDLFRSMFISKICILARRDAIEQAGRFDTALRMGEDYELMLRLSRLGGFAGTDAVVAHRRRHGTNLTADTAGYRVRTAGLLERFYFKLDGWREVDRAVAQRRLARVHYAAGKKLLAAGDGSAARFHLARASAFDPTFKTVLLRIAASLLTPFARKRVGPELPDGYQFIPTEEAVSMLGQA